MPSRIIAPALHAARFAAVTILCLVSCGCGLAYKNRLSRDGFVVYTNDGQGFLEKTGDQIETIYDSLAKVFEIPKPFPGPRESFSMDRPKESSTIPTTPTCWDTTYPSCR